LTAEYFADRVKETQWRGFLRRNGLPEVSFEMAVLEIERFIMPLCRAIHGGEDFALLWTANGP
jgi:hypothetical protein